MQNKTSLSLTCKDNWHKYFYQSVANSCANSVTDCCNCAILCVKVCLATNRDEHAASQAKQCIYYNECDVTSV